LAKVESNLTGGNQRGRGRPGAFCFLSPLALIASVLVARGFALAGKKKGGVSRAKHWGRHRESHLYTGDSVEKGVGDRKRGAKIFSPTGLLYSQRSSKKERGGVG